MKKSNFFLAVILCIALGLCVALPMCASAATEGYYTYTVSNGEATITDFDTSVGGSITIPSTIGGYPVTGIKRYAFENCTGLTAIIVPDSVTNIGNGAFKGCTSLEKITLPFVGSKRGNTGTESSVLGYIFDYGDYMDSRDSESRVLQRYAEDFWVWELYYFIPDSLREVVITDDTRIPYGAFSNCDMLTSITLSDNVKAIADYAFENCSYASVIIPPSVESISDYAFWNCNKITIKSFSGTKAHSFATENGITFESLDSEYYEYVNDAGNLVITGFPSDISGKIVIPSAIGGYPVKAIGDYAFYSCTKLTSVKIPEGVTHIGLSAFANCTSLGTVIIPRSVTSIADEAFAGSNVTTIKGYRNSEAETYANAMGMSFVALDDEEHYTYIVEDGYATITACSTSASGNVKVPATINDYPVKAIAEGAFRNCVNITSITVSDGVEFVGEYAFEGCSGLKTIVLPDSVSYAGDGYLKDCSSLEVLTIPFCGPSDGYKDFSSIFWPGNVPTTITNITITGGKEIMSYSFSGCYNLTSITLPEGLERIGMGAFEGCAKLKSVNIPSTITKIECAVFNGCSALEEITIPQGVKTIETYAFYGSGLKSISIPDTVTNIGSNAFSECTSLTKVSLPSGITAIPDFAFAGCTSLTELPVSDNLAIIGNNSFSRCTSLTSVFLHDGVTTIDEMAFANCDNLYSITIPDSVTYIGTDAFVGCNKLTIRAFKGSAAEAYAKEKIIPFDAIEVDDVNYAYKIAYGEAIITGFDSSFGGELVIPETLRNYPVTRIENDAFKGRSKLTRISLPDTVETIGSYAFSGCTGLTEIILPENVEFDCGAFSGCTALTSVTIPDGVTSLDMWLFKNCIGLSKINLPDSLKSIEKYAFEGCTALLSADIPDGVTSIGEGAFYGCSKMESLSLPASLDSVDEKAFQGCSKLTSVTIQGSLTTIEAYIFADCTDLSEITIPESVVSINDYAFDGCTSLTIKGYTGSVAQAYAKAKDIPFEALDSEPESYTYEIIDGKAVITDCNSSFAGSLEIPGFIDNCPVSAIGDYAFEGCTELTYVILPESIVSIGRKAFRGSGFFNNSDNWTDGLLYCGNYLVDATTDITSCTVKTGTVLIAGGTFENNANLAAVVIPESVEHIEKNAFSGCANLTLYGYSDSYAETYAKENEISFWEFDGSNDEFYTYTVSGGNAKITDFASYVRGDIQIPPTLGGYPVTSIGNDAFSSCNSITSVVIPYGITSIGNSAFENCGKLVSIVVPNSVKTIGAGSFKGCNSLEEITLPFIGSQRGKTGSMSAVFGYIFDYSSYSGNGTTQQFYTSSASRYYYIPATLRRVVITDETLVPYGAFNNCANLTSITIPATVTVIEDRAFDGCGNFVMQGSKKSEAASYAFANSITYMPVDCEEEYYSYVIINDEAKLMATDTSISGNIVLPDSMEGYPLTGVGKNSFKDCSKLTAVTVPECVATIGEGAFSGCSSLTEITLPFAGFERGDSAGFFRIFGNDGADVPKTLKKVAITDDTVINAAEFKNCSAISQITLSKTVTTIDNGAFEGCTSLKEITLPFIGRERGGNNKADAVFGYIFGQYTSGENGRIRQNYSSSASAYYAVPESITKVTVTDEDVLAYGAFNNCINLSNVILEEKVSAISQNAFADCYNLFDVTVYNKNARFANNANIFSNADFVTLHGYANSTTQTYAGNYSYAFTTIDDGGSSALTPYTVTSLRILKSTDGSVLSSIPVGDFMADATITNVSSTGGAIVVFVTYDKFGSMKKFTYTHIIAGMGKSESKSVLLNNSNGDVAYVKVFVWNSLTGLKPVSNSEVFPK